MTKASPLLVANVSFAFSLAPLRLKDEMLCTCCDPAEKAPYGNILFMSGYKGCWSTFLFALKAGLVAKNFYIVSVTSNLAAHVWSTQCRRKKTNYIVG